MVEKKDRKLYVIKTQKADNQNNWNIKRTRIEVTPAVCVDCGFDVLEKNGLGKWEDLDENVKDRVKAALAEHKKSHVATEKRLLYEDEIPASNIKLKRYQK